jgi:menaquinone reductase, molybdopterin-binding-like subunit
MFALPQANHLAKAFDESYMVSFSTFYDETAAKADLLLPTSYFLERFDDVQTPYGSGFASYSLTRPVMKPVFDTKPAGDVILGISKKLGFDLGFSSHEKVLEAKVSALAELEGFMTDKVQPWEVRVPVQMLHLPRAIFGGTFPEALSGLQRNPSMPGCCIGTAIITQAAPPDIEEWTYPVRLAAMDSRTYGSRHIAIPPFNLPLMGEQELQGDIFYVQMNSATAAIMVSVRRT